MLYYYRYHRTKTATAKRKKQKMNFKVMKVNTWHNLFTSLAMLLPNIVCTGSFESTHFLQDISPSACSTSAHLSALKSTSPPLCSSFLWPITFFEMHHYQHHSGHWGWVTSGLTTLIQSDALCQKNPPAQISWAAIAHEWHTKTQRWSHTKALLVSEE